MISAPFKAFKADVMVPMLAICREFLSKPGPTTAPVQCTIVRDTEASRTYPSYSLFLDDPAELILAARKRKKSKTSNYILSLDNEVMSE